MPFVYVDMLQDIILVNSLFLFGNQVYVCNHSVPCQFLLIFGFSCILTVLKLEMGFFFFTYQTFDLATMKPNEVDFTATASLEPKLSASENEETHLKSKTCCWCYGVVLWFETGFTSRFCREAPAVLSTSPYTPKTHWSQTILTFREPIAMGFGKENGRKPEAIGTEVYPAVKIDLRVSIVRSTEHRSIDISLEAAGVGPDGRRRSWPAQLFSLQ